jgi:hypothetical protein
MKEGAIRDSAIDNIPCAPALLSLSSYDSWKRYRIQRTTNETRGKIKINLN